MWMNLGLFLILKLFIFMSILSQLQKSVIDFVKARVQAKRYEKRSCIDLIIKCIYWVNEK